MTRVAFRLTATAAGHYRDILFYTARRYGEEQATIYADALEEGFQRIIENHASFASPHRDTLAQGTDFRLYLAEHHYIAFKIGAENLVVIAAILHERMNIPVRLRELQQMSKDEIALLEEEIARDGQEGRQ